MSPPCPTPLPSATQAAPTTHLVRSRCGVSSCSGRMVDSTRASRPVSSTSASSAHSTWLGPGVDKDTTDACAHEDKRNDVSIHVLARSPCMLQRAGMHAYSSHVSKEPGPFGSRRRRLAAGNFLLHASQAPTSSMALPPGRVCATTALETSRPMWCRATTESQVTRLTSVLGCSTCWKGDRRGAALA